MDTIKKYWNSAYTIILPLIPTLCMCAGAYQTVCKALGYYPETPWFVVILSDTIQIVYVCISLFIIYKNKKNPNYISDHSYLVKYYIMLFVVIQYSFILFLFPISYTWECAILFLLMTVFFFDTKLQFFNSVFCFSSLIVSYTMNSDDLYEKSISSFLGAFSFQIALFLITAFILIIIVHMTGLFLAQAQENHEKATYLLKKQLSYYNQVDLMDRELRKFRHDIQNHFICIDALLKQGKNEELTQYFKDLQTKFNAQEHLYYTGNDVVDVILNYELSHHCDKQIQISVQGKLPPIQTVSSMDLCTVFSNILTNAIHAINACDTLKEQILNIQFQWGNQYFTIVICNSTDKPLKDASSPRKTNRNHGHGLHIIKDIIKKYNGFFGQTKENQIVTTTVILPL